MQLWHLRTFQAVARTLHFTRASEELNLSQPAVSHQIKALEEEVAESLFVRGKDGISLTPAGKVMLEHADRILSIADRIRMDIEDARRDPRGLVRMAIVSRSLEHNFVDVYLAFKEEYPDIDLQFRVESDIQSLFQALDSGIIDIAIASQKPIGSSFESIPYGMSKLCFVVGPDHRFANRESIEVDELGPERFALFEASDPYRRVIDKRFKQLGFTPKSIFSTNDGSVIRDFVNLGLMVSLLPSGIIINELNDGRLIHVPVPELESEHEIHICWSLARKKDAIVTFAKFIVERELPGIDLSREKRRRATG